MLLIPIKCTKCKTEFFTGTKENETSAEVVCPVCGAKDRMFAVNPAQTVMMRTDREYLHVPVPCLTCGKQYVPADGQYLDELDVPPVLANNWCSRKCYNQSFEENVPGKYTYCRACKMRGINLPGNKICGNCGSSDTFLLQEVIDEDEQPLDDTPAQASTAGEINAMVEERNERLLKSKYCELHKDVCVPDAAGFGGCGDLLKDCIWKRDENIEDETRIRN